MELIKCLSVYQLRSHYLCYFLFKKNGKANTNIGTAIERENNTIFIPFKTFTKSMEFSESEEHGIILAHVIAGLVTKGLLGSSYSYGTQSHLKRTYNDCPEEGGIILEPTVLGAELFLWAEGINTIEASAFLTSEFRLPKPIIPISDKGTLMIKK